MQNIVLNYLGATVRFKETDCDVPEDIGSVKHTLVLNKPLSANVSIRVDTVDQTTSSELRNVHMYIYVICDCILENRLFCHISYFEKYKF